MRKFCSIVSILLLSILFLCGCNSKEYYFNLIKTNYTVNVDEIINLDDLEFNTNIPNCVDKCTISSDNLNVKIENKNIIALSEGNAEILLTISFEDNKYTQKINLIINDNKPLVLTNCKYSIINTKVNIDCLTLIFDNFKQANKFLELDILKEDGFIDYKKVGLKININYYKNTSFENSITKFLLENNVQIIK